jgi:hypothetical protein
MIDLASNIHVILQDVGYKTWAARASADWLAIGFEDDAVMGFISVSVGPEELLERWQQIERELLIRYAPNFRDAGDKAWNVYCAFVTAARASEGQRRAIRLIEENLENTRKITATGIVTRADLETALLPLLPIVSKPVLEPEDPVARLRRRITSIAPGADAAILDPSVSPETAARVLGRPA